MEVKKRVVHGNHKGDDGYVYRFFSNESGAYSSHIHDCYEFIYITEGCCIYTIEGREHFVMGGDIIFTRPGELHSFSFPERCTFARHFLHIYPKYIENIPLLKETFFAKENIKKCFISSELAEKYELDRIFKRLEKYADSSVPETSVIAYSAAVELMAKIMKIMRCEDMTRRNPVANECTYKLMQYVDAHFRETITLDDMAKFVMLSKYHISRIFKREVGMTISTYINMRRILHAKNKILQGGKIINIFNECGYNDYSTFYRAFVRIAGISPEEFKQKAEKLNNV